MPQKLIETYLSEKDYTNKQLALLFDVSEEAMAIRLDSLGMAERTYDADRLATATETYISPS